MIEPIFKKHQRRSLIFLGVCGPLSLNLDKTQGREQWIPSVEPQKTTVVPGENMGFSTSMLVYRRVYSNGYFVDQKNNSISKYC
jgi:hypothetical protein